MQGHRWWLLDYWLYWLLAVAGRGTLLDYWRHRPPVVYWEDDYWGLPPPYSPPPIPVMRGMAGTL